MLLAKMARVALLCLLCGGVVRVRLVRHKSSRVAPPGTQPQVMLSWWVFLRAIVFTLENPWDRVVVEQERNNYETEECDAS